MKGNATNNAELSPLFCKLFAMKVTRFNAKLRFQLKHFFLSDFHNVLTFLFVSSLFSSRLDNNIFFTDASVLPCSFYFAFSLSLVLSQRQDRNTHTTAFFTFNLLLALIFFRVHPSSHFPCFWHCLSSQFSLPFLRGTPRVPRYIRFSSSCPPPYPSLLTVVKIVARLV